MTYCREGHTLVDDEAEGNWDQLIPGTFFELEVNSVTYFGIVDEYIEPTPTTLVCRLYSDAGRTTLVIAGIPTGLPYLVDNFVAFSWSKNDLIGRTIGNLGTWVSPQVVVRDDTGVWVGNWIAEPKPTTQGSVVEFRFEGTHTLFVASVENFTAVEVAGAGLGAGTYQYVIAPVDTGVLLGAGSRIQTVVLAGAADIQLDWGANNQVTSWNIYGRQIGGAFGLMTNVPGATLTYTDNNVDTPGVPVCPPLVEESGWVPAVANRVIDVTSDGINTTGPIDETGNTIVDNGSVVSDAEDVGGLVVDNITEGLKFDIAGLESTIIYANSIVLDPNIFDPASPPTGQIIVITYDYHVFINGNGFTVIVETDSGTGQTKKIIVNTVTNTFDGEITENGIVIGTFSIPIDPTFVIPAPGSLSITVTYDNVTVLSDGTIIGDERIEINTYIATPQPVPGTLVVLNSDFAANHRIKVSVDSALTWTNTTLASKISPPFSFDMEDSDLFWGHGEGWTILITVDDPNIALVTDFAFHWTNDPTLATWPFNDTFGRVAQGDLTQAAFDRIWSSGIGFGPTVIIAPANGIGVMAYVILVGTADEIQFGFSTQEFNVFFPATGVFTSITWVSVGGPLNILSYTVWPEKNMVIGIEESSNEIHIWDLTTSQAAPLTNHRQLESLTENPGFGFFKICHSPTEIFVHYGDALSLDVRTARSSDGITWSQVLHNSIGDFDPSTPGQEIIGMLPDHWAYVRDLGKYIFTQIQTIFSSSDADSWGTNVKAANTLDQDAYEYIGTNLNPESSQPILWDGTLLALGGPDNAAAGFPGTFQRFDSSFVDASPLTGGSSGGVISKVHGTQGVTLGDPADPNNIPFANVRGFIGRPVNIPVAVAAIPAPFRIRNITISPVYSTTSTQPFNGTYNSPDIGLQSGPRGGLGNAIYTKLIDGQIIMRHFPSNVPAEDIQKWRTPHIKLPRSSGAT